MEENDSEEHAFLWETALESALKEEISLEELRKLCSGRLLPVKYRIAVWKRLLSISDYHIQSIKIDEEFNLSCQSALRDSCKEHVAKSTGEEDLELVYKYELLATNICKLNKCLYDPKRKWLEVLDSLVSLEVSHAETVEMFNSIYDMFLPKHQESLKACSNFFRLLLLYHDPELCSVFDNQKIDVGKFSAEWFLTLFAVPCLVETTQSLWDMCFTIGDPYLAFFIALLLIVNMRDQILELQRDEPEKIPEVLVSMPSQLEPSDVLDLYSLVLFYEVMTPQSFRKLFHETIFGEGDSSLDQHFSDVLAEANHVPLNQSLCLPVTVGELVDSLQSSDEDGKRKFKLIDCRPYGNSSSGHVPGAVNLDCSVLLQDPTVFSSLTDAIFAGGRTDGEGDRTSEHYCFMGSGRLADDGALNMTISYFLQRKKEHVSVLVGGFSALHDAIIHNEDGNISTLTLTGHDAQKCPYCSASSGTLADEISEAADLQKKEEMKKSESGTFLGGIFSKSFFSKSIPSITPSLQPESTIFGKLLGYIAPEEEPVTRKERKQRSSNKRQSRPYRNLPAVFSLNDDEQNSDEDEDKLDTNQFISEWLRRPDLVGSYECHEIDEKGRTFPSFLMITRTHFFCLRKSVKDKDSATISVQKDLKSVFKITSKKRQPEFLTFKFGKANTEGNYVVDDCARFYVQNAGDATKAVKMQIISLNSQEDTAQGVA